VSGKTVKNRVTVYGSLQKVISIRVSGSITGRMERESLAMWAVQNTVDTLKIF
jgi:hypothetical protein